MPGGADAMPARCSLHPLRPPTLHIPPAHPPPRAHAKPAARCPCLTPMHPLALPFLPCVQFAAGTRVPGTTYMSSFRFRSGPHNILVQLLPLRPADKGIPRLVASVNNKPVGTTAAAGPFTITRVPARKAGHGTVTISGGGQAQQAERGGAVEWSGSAS